ncbi:hypothetical protein FGRMN_4833 [Fusarium graminum]|nr:hypothetical protein FGRMN_4833 [Fusarium graminum]
MSNEPITSLAVDATNRNLDIGGGGGPLKFTHTPRQTAEIANQSRRQIGISETPKILNLGVSVLQNELRPAHCGQAQPPPVQAEPSDPRFPGDLQIQNQSRLPDLDGVVKRFRAATIEWAEWSQTDPWAKKYAGNKNKIVAATESLGLVDKLKAETQEDYDEVEAVFQSNTPSIVLERQARLVKGFIGDAAALLDASGDLVSHSNSNIHSLSLSQEPSAWVSDRNWDPKDPEASSRKFGQVLNRRELWAALQKKFTERLTVCLMKRFFRKGENDEPGPPRRVYINKPDGGSILALLRTTPASQTPGLQALLANYITVAPTPVIRSREIAWWHHTCFLFHFSLPFFVISPKGHQDSRKLFNGQDPLRRRHDLSFLHLGDQGQDYYYGNESPTNPFLLEAVCSIMVTGQSEHYWTTVCLNDDFAEDTDDQRLPSEEDIEHLAGETDPITLQTDDKIGSPRAYALATLAGVLAKVANYHKDIKDQFGTSLNRHTHTSWHGSPEKITASEMREWRKRYPGVLNWVIYYNSSIIEKLEHFLNHHLMLTPEGIPGHPLWQSVHKEEKAVDYLTDIKDTLDSLWDIDRELRRFLIEASRENESGHQEEQLGRDKNLHKIAFAGFVLAILNLIAQIYAGRPQDTNALLSPGFMALMVFCFLLCVICLTNTMDEDSRIIASTSLQRLHGEFDAKTGTGISQWAKRFGIRVKTCDSDVNKAYVDLLRHRNEAEFDEIPAIMGLYPTSAHWDRRVARAEESCEHGDFGLRYFLPDDPGNTRLRNVQEPKAWVSCDTHVPRDGTYSRPDAKDCFKQRYVSNPDGASLLALLRATPAFHVDGFRKLLAGHLNPNPVPELTLIDSNSWGGKCFFFCFHLPFVVMSSQGLQDNRTFSVAERSLRTRHDLSFLKLREATPESDSGRSSLDHDAPVLHEAVYSLMITGPSEDHWTAVCLDDDILTESHSRRRRQINQIGHAMNHVLVEYVTGSNAILIQRLSDFLEDTKISQNETLHDVLWQDLQSDKGALKSLRKIKTLISQLRDIGFHFEWLRTRYERLALEAMHCEAAIILEDHNDTNHTNHPEQKDAKDTIGLRIAIAAFATTTFIRPLHIIKLQPKNHKIVAMAATTCSVSGIENLLGKAGLDTPIPEFPGADIVHNPQDIFRVYLADLIQKLINCDRKIAYDAIQTSNITGMGDLVIVAPRLRLQGTKPEDLVSDLARRLPISPPFSCPLKDGIRLQVFSSPNTLSRLLLSYISDRATSYGYDESLGLADSAVPNGPKKKLLVEFSSPNMASEFQVSHLRSTLIGTYVANLHTAMGWDVVKTNYLGDWGKQIGLLAAGWQRFGSEEEFTKQPLRHLLEVNHKIQELFKPEVENCKAAKANNQDVTEIESQGLYAERDAFFKRMEDRDPEAIAVWQRFRDATVADYTDSYAKLGVVFDEYSGESQVTAESIAEVEEILKEKGIYEEHEDSWKIDFAKHDAKGLSIAIVRYRNGTTSYLLRDLAAVFDRYKKHSFDKMIYVVAMEQEMHFQRVTKTLSLMGRQDLANRIQHVSFAKITTLPDELKSAKLLSDYIDGCHSIVHAGLEEEEEESLHVDTSDTSVDLLGLAGLFIQDHYHKRSTSYASDKKKIVSLEGETGAAIQNCYARLLKMLEPAPTNFDYATLDYASLEKEDYAELLRILLQYPDAVHGSFKTLEPSFIVVYLLRLVDQLMMTLDDDDDEKDWAGLQTANEARLALYENTRQVFQNALRLLGVAPWSS